MIKKEKPIEFQKDQLLSWLRKHKFRLPISIVGALICVNWIVGNWLVIGTCNEGSKSNYDFAIGFTFPHVACAGLTIWQSSLLFTAGCTHKWLVINEIIKVQLWRHYSPFEE